MAIACRHISGYDWHMDDNTFECPNCGARVYPEMTRCPECGQNMYPEDEEDQVPTGSVEDGQTGWLASLGVVLTGWIISCGIALLLNFLAASFTNPAIINWPGKTVLFLAGPLAAVVGSYVATGISPRHHKWLGIVIGVLVLPILALYSTRWVTVTMRFLLDPWVIAAGLLTILAGAGGSRLNHFLSKETDWKEKWRVRGWEDMLYQDLLRKVRFNGSIADRLIEFERKQDPQASRLKLIQSAIDRWERDNR